ncbi:hypothetical protein AtDm6_1067 [Acetobacter tropicalis]|uniref:Uncharacterized protein n=2 Tax=Acetobacter tropicalis TaxID=104102 RepID=A0A094YRR8_9PROT|nr:hypothetical protein AtDm6_1067 [Acetobacter tropicalis]
MPLSALPTASAVTPNDKVWGIVGGNAKLVQPKDLVAAGLPDDVVKTDDLDAALSSSALSQYTDQAVQHAADAKTGAAQSQTGAAAAAVSAGQAAQTGVQVATIAESAKTNNDAAQQAVAGVTADANAAKVLLTAAMQGDAPLNYRGYWDAGTNTPALASGNGAEGDLYIVSVAGTTALDGNTAWSVGDGAWFTGGKWVYFARAGWAAVAQSLYALGTLTVAGVTTGGAASNVWLTAWLNAYAEVLAGIEADGSPIFPGARGRVGPHQYDPSALPGAGLILLDELGSVIDNRSSRAWPGATPVDAVPAPIVRRLLGRGPGAQDCGVRGFSRGSLWLYGNALYQSLYDTADAACWDVLASNDGAPLASGFGASVAAVYGLDAMVSGYTGPAIDISTIVAGVTTSTTIAVLSSGSLDTEALSATLSNADSGTVATVTQWYDQSGGGHHLTVPSGASAPRIGQTQVNGRPCISFDTSGASAAQRLSNTALTFAGGTFSVFGVGRAAGTNCSGDDRISALSVGSGTARIATVSGINEDGYLGVWDGAVLQPGHKMQTCNPGVFGISASGGDTVSVWHGSTPDPITVTAAALAGVMTGLSIGSGDDLSNASNFEFTGLVALRMSATQAQVDLIARRASLRYGFAPQTALRIICIGDSRTAGYINQDGANWPTMLPDYLIEPADIYNVAVSGSTTRDAVNYTLASIQAAISGSAVPTICTLWLGVNDFARIGGSDYSVLARIKTLIDGVTSSGALHVFLISEAYIYNQLTWQGATASGYFGANVTLINPFQAGIPFTDHSNAELWHPDNIHPTRAGDRFLASLVSAKINTYIEANS